MKIAIRRAVADDLRPLAALARKTYVDAFGPSFRAPDLRAHLERNLADDRFSEFLREDVILVAEREGDMIGFTQIGSAKAENFDFAIARGDQELRRIYVLKSFQRNGVGGALIDAALQLPASVEAPRIFLEVWEENLAARRFYERRDFEACGKRAFIPDSGVATGFELIMARRKRTQR
jgi:ribosomal protein S18 acetylase RimI-like enzyme